MGANLNPQITINFLILFFSFPDMVLTFSKWPFRIFYDYSKRFNKVFCENVDIHKEILAFYKVKIGKYGLSRKRMARQE